MEGERGCFASTICGVFSNKRPQRCFMLLLGLGLAALTVISSVNPEILGLTESMGETMQYVFGGNSVAAFTGWGVMKATDRFNQYKAGRASGEKTAAYIIKDVLAAGLLIAAVSVFMACGSTNMLVMSCGSNDIPLTVGVGLSSIFVIGGLVLNVVGSRTDANAIYAPDEIRDYLLRQVRDHKQQKKAERKQIDSGYTLDSEESEVTSANVRSLDNNDTGFDIRKQRMSIRAGNKRKCARPSESSVSITSVPELFVAAGASKSETHTQVTSTTETALPAPKPMTLIPQTLSPESSTKGSPTRKYTPMSDDEIDDFLKGVGYQGEKSVDQIIQEREKRAKGSPARRLAERLNKMIAL